MLLSEMAEVKNATAGVAAADAVLHGLGSGSSVTGNSGVAAPIDGAASGLKRGRGEASAER
jgi:hypothetical protein